MLHDLGAISASRPPSPGHQPRKVYGTGAASDRLEDTK